LLRSPEGITPRAAIRAGAVQNVVYLSELASVVLEACEYDKFELLLVAADADFG